MIQIADPVFYINTKNTSYIFCATAYADLEHLYYGSGIEVDEAKSTSDLYLMQKLFSPVRDLLRICLEGLMEQETYKIAEIGLCASGEVFMKHGVLLPQNFKGYEESGEMSRFFDFTAKAYKIERGII